jgi:hypothetical protein
MKRNLFRTMLLAGLTLSAVIAAPKAQADTLQLGSHFTTPIYVTLNGIAETAGGGSIGPSYLNGYLLPYVYCVQLDVSIGVPNTYNATVTHDGTVYYSTGNAVVNNAAQIAWLLDTYAGSATTSDQQGALQASIWTEIYGNKFTLTSANTTGMINDYNIDMKNVGTASLSNFSWLSPYDSNGIHYQDLVTTTPEPGNLPMLVGMTITGVGFLIRRRRRG